jgi:transposase
MDGAYPNDATRELASQMGLMAVVPPHPKRKPPWAYDTRPYRQRNRIERLFRRLKAWRRVE